MISLRDFKSLYVCFIYIKTFIFHAYDLSLKLSILWSSILWSFPNTFKIAMCFALNYDPSTKALIFFTFITKSIKLSFQIVSSLCVIKTYIFSNIYVSSWNIFLFIYETFKCFLLSMLWCLEKLFNISQKSLTKTTKPSIYFLNYHSEWSPYIQLSTSTKSFHFFRSLLFLIPILTSEKVNSKRHFVLNAINM